MMKECNIYIKERYDRLDPTEKAELTVAAEKAKLDLSRKQADDNACDFVPVRDTSKAAQIKAVNNIQNEIASLQTKLRSYQMGMFVAYVPMSKDCPMQKPTCDRNCPALQSYFLSNQASTTGSMLLRAREYVKGELISDIYVLGVLQSD